MLQVLIDVDPGVADDLDVLPALRPGRPGHVRVGQLVDEGDGRVPGHDRVRVHLLDDDAAVVDPPTRDDLEAVEQLRGRGRGRAASTKPTTRSVPRAARRCASSSIR